ncbi:MAG: response regulator transcription factor [Flavobacteriales bacterium]|nr:response regulator transcription factor [Flavobacteriales bacterium]
MGLLAEGHTYAQVAERLHLSAFTVKNHTHRIIKKMKAPNRVAAINRFMNRGDMGRFGPYGVLGVGAVMSGAV